MQKTHIGHLPLAPMSILAQIYGVVVFRLSVTDFNAYCLAHCAIRKG